jgi:hypothetical protein
MHLDRVAIHASERLASSSGRIAQRVCLCLQRKRGEATPAFARVTGRARCATSTPIKETSGESDVGSRMFEHSLNMQTVGITLN